MTTPRFLTVLKFSRPLNLILAALAYLLGAGIARYLGFPQNSAAFWLGLTGVALTQASIGLLAEAFRPLTEPQDDEEEAPRAECMALRNTLLLVAIVELAFLGILALLLTRSGALSPTALLFLALSLGLALSYAVPPLRLVNSGFGEFALAVHIAMIAPALGFVLQEGEYHRLVGIISFPLMLLALAYFLALNFPTYATDQKYDRRTLLRSVGWESAIPLHHGLVSAAYLLLAGSLLFGLAWGLIWPVFLTLPFALLQIYWLHNLALGAKPNWKLLTINALAVFGLSVYLLTFAFWMR